MKHIERPSIVAAAGNKPKIIEEYVETGKSSAYEDLKSTVPVGLVPMLQIEGLGPKTINLLWKQLNITSLEELEKAIESELSGNVIDLCPVGALLSKPRLVDS